MLRSDVSMASNLNTLWIHGIYEIMTNVHGHEQYIVDPCDIYELASMAMRNTQWIHVNVDHSHEQIHNGAMSQNQKKGYMGPME
jgi:hypothetical protein